MFSRFFRMKSSEKKLLNHLTGEQSDVNIPLQNIRKAMGSLRYVTGNPLTKSEINIKVSIFYCDVAVGTLITPAALPAAVKSQLPVFILGLMDMYGGWLNSKTLSYGKVSGNWKGYNTLNTISHGIYNYNIHYADLAVFSIPFANQLTEGDYVSLFYQTSGATYIAMVVIHCDNTAYGTFLTSFVSDLITIDTIRYIVPIANVDQFNNTLNFGYQELLGKMVTDTINPKNYISNTDFQQQICDIPVDIPIDKALMLATALNFDCEYFNFILFVKKIEALTHKYKQ